MDTFPKQPAEVLDYDTEADSWLPSDDFIVSVTATATTGITLSRYLIFNSGRSVKVWLSGGTSGSTYIVTLAMTTNDGRVKEHEFRIKVKEL